MVKTNEKIVDLQNLQIKPCKTKGGISAKSSKINKLNLLNIKKKFSKKLVLDTPILLVVDYGKLGGNSCGEIIIHQHGQLTFKELKDEKAIRHIAEEIFKAGFLN